MACSSLKQQQQNSFISPRISFSNGFAETGGELIKQQLNSTTAAAAGDFEFNVATYSMNSADELFFNGKLLPLSEENNTYNNDEDVIIQDFLSPTFKNMKVTPTTTLRDELLIDDYDSSDDHQYRFRSRLPRALKGTSSASGCKWKERFSGFKIKSTLL